MGTGLKSCHSAKRNRCQKVVLLKKRQNLVQVNICVFFRQQTTLNFKDKIHTLENLNKIFG